MQIKAGPQRWQDHTEEVDVAVCFEERAGPYTPPLHSSTQAVLVSGPFCVQFVTSCDPSIE
jgi:hypothetical protein